MATMTTKEVAEKLDTSTRTLRRFLRSEVKAAGGEVGVDTPGKGKRYVFETAEVKKLQKQFTKWSEKQAEARAARAEAENAEAESIDSE